VSEGTEVATYTVLANGIIEVEFNDEVEVLKLEELEGTFTLQGKIEAEEVDEEEEIVEEDKKSETSDSEEVPAKEEGAEATEETEDENFESVDEEDPDDTDTTESNEEEVSNTEENKYKAATNAIQETNDEEKQGFNLNLGSVTDLDGDPYDADNLLEPRDEFNLKLDWNLTDGHGY